VRPLSILAAAVLNMQDVIETRGYNKHAIKSQSRFGTVIETDAVATAPVGVPGGPGAGTNIRVPITKPDGTTATINMEAVYSGGVTPGLAPGQKMKVITDDRPSMNNQAFEEALLKDCCYTAGVSYERLCNLAGLTGPALRTLNSDEKRWVKLNHYEQSKRIHNQVIYTLSLEMAAGRLRQPKLQPGELWTQAFQYIGLAASDIDGGRTAAATLTDLKSGQTTWLETWGAKGAYWKKAIKQAISETIFAEVECLRQSAAAGLPEGRVTPERVFPDRYTLPTPPLTGVAPQAVDGDAPDPQNEPEPIE
jgi:capsid protein